MAEEGSGWEELRTRLRSSRRASLRRRSGRSPVEPVEGRTVAFFSTAPEAAHETLAKHLREEHGADVVHVSGSLSDRGKLREELEQVEADVFLVELKAAAIDVVAETAAERGIQVVFAGSEVLSADGQDLDAELLRLAGESA